MGERLNSCGQCTRQASAAPKGWSSTRRWRCRTRATRRTHPSTFFTVCHRALPSGQVKFYTAHHDKNHCFSETVTRVEVEVFGDWLPRSILGRLYAVFAYLRMVYVAVVMVLWCPPCHVIFCDQAAATLGHQNSGV